MRALPAHAVFPATAAGDAVALPAGTGHCRLTGSADLRVVGAYPAAQTCDLLTRDPDAPLCRRIGQVPARDPVTGDT